MKNFLFKSDANQEFNASFFSYKNDKEQGAAATQVDFVLPTLTGELDKTEDASVSLKTFFQGEHWELYKQRCCQMIDAFALWAKAHGLDANLDDFKKLYFDYSFSNDEENTTRFPIYAQGLPSIGKLNTLLASDNIPLDVRKTIAANVLEGIMVCSPGTYTHITNAISELKGYHDISLQFMFYRKKFAEQLVLELLRHFDLPDGMPIHYVNGVLNLCADELAIEKIEDGLVKLCNQDVLNNLLEQFKELISQRLTIDSIINFILKDLLLESRPAQLKNAWSVSREAYNDEVHDIEKRLNLYGETSSGTGYIRIGGIIEINTECAPFTFTLRPDAVDVMKRSLLQQIHRAGHVRLEEEPFTLENKVVAQIYKGISLEYAYCPERYTSEPFITYCVDKLLGSDAESSAIIVAIKSHKFTDNQLLDVIKALIERLKNDSFKDKKSSAWLVGTINQLIPFESRWDTIASMLSVEAASIYLSTIDEIILARDFVKTRHQLRLVLKIKAMQDFSVNFILALNNKIDLRSALLNIAAKKGYIKIIQVAVENGADVNLTNERGNAPLHAAVMKDNIEIIELLLELKAKVNLPGMRGFTPLHAAALDSGVEVVRLLLENGAVATLITEDGSTPLYIAALEDNIEVVELLIDHGADVDCADHEGRTPLFAAVENANLDVARLLLAKEANVNAVSKMGFSPLHVAAEHNLDLVRLLLVNKANVNATVGSVPTPMFIAAFRDNIDLARLLLEYHADVNLTINAGMAPLHVVAGQGNVEFARLLLENNADINLEDESGLTPLIAAFFGNSLPVVKLLLEKSAHISNSFMTALNIMSGHTGEQMLMPIIAQVITLMSPQMLALMLVWMREQSSEKKQIFSVIKAYSKANETFVEKEKYKACTSAFRKLCLLRSEKSADEFLLAYELFKKINDFEKVTDRLHGSLTSSIAINKLEELRAAVKNAYEDFTNNDSIDTATCLSTSEKLKELAGSIRQEEVKNRPGFFNEQRDAGKVLNKAMARAPRVMTSDTLPRAP